MASAGSGSGVGARGSPRSHPSDVIEDPDPMMQALYGNILSLEKVLQTLHSNACNLLKANNYACLSMVTLAANIDLFCAADPALAQDTAKYHEAISSLAGRGVETPRAALAGQIENKVLKPLNVNLTVLSEIKSRMREREALRKTSQRKGIAVRFAKRPDPKQAAADFERMTSELFEELTALYQHRFDFVRAPYQALKSCQLEFFLAAAAKLEQHQGPAPRPATSSGPPRLPPAKQSKSAVDIVKESPTVTDSKRFVETRARLGKNGIRTKLVDKSDSFRRYLAGKSDGNASSGNQSNESQSQVLVARPVDTGFNLDADRPCAGTAYLRLGKARGADAIGTRLGEAAAGTNLTESSFKGADELGQIKIKINKPRRQSAGRLHAKDALASTKTGDSLESASAGHVAMAPPPLPRTSDTQMASAHSVRKPAKRKKSRKGDTQVPPRRADSVGHAPMLFEQQDDDASANAFQHIVMAPPPSIPTPAPPGRDIALPVGSGSIIMPPPPQAPMPPPPTARPPSQGGLDLGTASRGITPIPKTESSAAFEDSRSDQDDEDFEFSEFVGSELPSQFDDGDLSCTEESRALPDLDLARLDVNDDLESRDRSASVQSIESLSSSSSSTSSSPSASSSSSSSSQTSSESLPESSVLAELAESPHASKGQVGPSSILKENKTSQGGHPSNGTVANAQGGPRPGRGGEVTEVDEPILDREMIAGPGTANLLLDSQVPANEGEANSRAPNTCGEAREGDLWLADNLLSSRKDSPFDLADDARARGAGAISSPRVANGRASASLKSFASANASDLGPVDVSDAGAEIHLSSGLDDQVLEEDSDHGFPGPTELTSQGRSRGSSGQADVSPAEADFGTMPDGGTSQSSQTAVPTELVAMHAAESGSGEEATTNGVIQGTGLSGAEGEADAVAEGEALASPGHTTSSTVDAEFESGASSSKDMSFSASDTGEDDAGQSTGDELGNASISDSNM